MPESNEWHALKKLIVHLIIGAIAFFSISFVAVLLSEWVSYLARNNFNPVIVKGLSAFEYMIFGMDLLLAGIFLGRSMYKFVKELW